MSGSENCAKRFRALHEASGIFIMPNPWDVGTARILETLGFPAIATASAALAGSLGKRDGQVDRVAALAHARTIVNATGLPVNADLENGYGDEPEQVAETVRQAIETGLAGCSIEDTTGDPRKPLYDRAHAVERIRAAKAAIEAAGSDFVLTARCEAYLFDHPSPLAECIDRLSEMAEAGADVAYACGIVRPEEIAALVRAVPRPVNVLGGTGAEPLSIGALEDLGVKRVSLGPRLFQAAMSGFVRAAQELAGSGGLAFMQEALPTGSIYDLIEGKRPV